MATIILITALCNSLFVWKNNGRCTYPWTVLQNFSETSTWICFISVEQSSQVQHYQNWSSTTKCSTVHLLRLRTYIERHSHAAETPVGLSNNAANEARVQMLYRIRNGLVAVPPQLTFNQLPFSTEDPKPDIGISSAEPTHSVIPSFLVQCACGMNFLLMSASCHRTALRLNCTPSHWRRHLPASFLSTALHCSLFLSALFVLLFGITASTSCNWTHHRGAILLDLRVGTFLEEEGRKCSSLFACVIARVFMKVNK